METDRLYLRERTKQMLDELLKLPTNDQLRFLGLESTEQLKSEIVRSQTRFENREMKCIKWDLIEKGSQRVIGNCGFHNWYVEHERAEIGYLLYESFRGKGFMLEAIKSIVEYGFNKMGLNRIEAFISPHNLPSKKIIEKAGFTQEGVLREHYKWENKIYDSVVFSLLKSEYKSN
jgi:[ribosomal protein S5]-alanine N-acetyltransferase